MKNNLFILFIILFCGFFSFSQNLNITIDGNGIVSCPSGLTALGDFNDISGKRIYVVDETLLREVTSTGSFTTGGTNYIPADLSCVCTTRVTNLNDLFVSTPTFNDDISNWDTSNVTTMEQTFFGTVSFTININSWDVSSVTDMDGMFRGATSFNQPLDNWNVGNVTTMSNMFREASAFNQPLNSWDVSKVKYMQFLFKSTIYNQPLNNWDVSSVLNMQEMFMGSDFNQPINNWEVGSVTNMYRLFRQSDFNQPLNNWDMSKVVNLGQMFYRNTGNFNQPLDNWVLSSANSISFIFENCRSFDQPLNNWDTSTITDMRGAFKGTHSFNRPLDNWDVSNVTRMDDMFRDARIFNENIDNWDVSSVTRMHEMFKDARVFNRNISGWTTTSLTDLSGMFWNAIAFTKNLNGWNVSNVNNMNNTFRNADAFNQPLNNWNTSNVSLLSGTFRANDVFNQDLSSWDTSSVTHMQETFMNNTVFNNGQSSGVSNTLQWDTSTVTRMDNMFEEATAFNGNISGWNVSNVTQMDRMFFNARVFNQDLSNWNTSSATTLQGMFNGATIFNNGLSAGLSSMIMNWSTSSVTTIESTFASAPAFNGNISGWDVSNVTVANNLFNAATNFNHPLGGWDVTSINNMNNMFAAASSFDQDLNCWCVVHNPSRSSFSNSSPINSKPLFLPRWAEPCDPSISFSTSVISQDDSPISPTIISSGGTFTASITGGIVHRVNQWGSGRADFLDINATTGEINPTTSLSGVYDITYSTGACKSFTTSITIRSVNNPLNQLSYTSSSVCKSIGGTLTPTIIPTNSHATVPRIYIDPGNPISYPNIGNAPNGETIVNLTTNSGFTHWEDGVVADVSGNHPNYMIISDNNGVVHKPGYSWELLPGATENNFITDQGGDRGYFPRESSSISMWVKESSWSSTTFLFDYTNGGDTDGKMWLSTINPSGELRWHIKTGARKKITSTATDIATSAALAYGVFAADMDGDGDMDILSASNADNTIAWYENNGDANPTWTANDIATDAAGANSVFAADMDGDGDMDIVSSSANDNTIAWYENDGNANPTWAAADIATSANSARSVFVADMDGDGDMDIVSASYNDNTIAWYENNGNANPTWTATDIATSAAGALSVYAADMDGDGDMDIVSASMLDNTIAWYENNGDANPTWAAADIATDAAGASGVYAADMDGDGDMDIVSADFSDNTIAWYENNGDANPTWTAADISTSAAGARDVHVADMDGDGDMDIVSADFGDNTIAWYENNGDANPTWTAADISTSAAGARDVHVADMDGDGDMDIVSADSGDNTIAWYESVITYGQEDNVNSMTNNNWHHLVMTRDESGNPAGGGIVKLYIDGVLTSVDYGTPTGALATPGDVIFGRNQQTQSGVNGLGKFTGEFGPIRIFAHELTQSEIEYEYDMFALRYKPDSFTATPAGLSINATNGIIDVSNSSGGVYQVTASWTEPSSGKVHTATQSITIKDPDASFSYSDNYFCRGSGGFADPSVITTGGSFTASPSTGLIIDSVSGRITPDTSTPGIYTIEYSLVECSATSTLSIEIVAQEAPLVTYTSYDSCKNVDPSISFTPTLSIAGGSFTSSPPGLNLNSVTGVIIPNSSQSGNYTINYTSAGRCPGGVSVPFIIHPLGNSTFSYLKSSFSKTISSIITPTINTIGGTFSSSPTGLNINTSNGAINPSLSDLGIYTILYNQGLCSSVSSSVIEIKTLNVILTDSDADNVVSPLDTITVTATFSEPVQSAPKVNFSGAGPNNIDMTATGSSSVWTYIFDFQSFSVSSSLYTLTVSATDLEGNPYDGNDNIIFDYRLLDPHLSLSNIVKNFKDPDFNLSATTSSSGNLSYAIADSSVATVSGSTVSISGAGSTIITVNQLLSGIYKAATATATLTVNKIAPTILSEIVTKIYGDPDFSVSAISSSTGTFSYQVMDTSVASNTGTNSITITGVGTTTIIISQTADVNFSTGSKTIILYVSKAVPTIITSNVVTKTYGDPDFNLTATSSSTGVFSFNALNSSVASISSNTVNITGAGTSTIIVSQASDGLYNAGSTSLTLIVYKADPIIHFPDVTKTFGDPDFLISATSSSTGDFAYSIDDLRIASPVSSIGNSTSTINAISSRGSLSRSSILSLFISISKAGSTTITAIQAEDSNYKSATATATLTIIKKDLDSSVWYPTSTITRTFGIPPFEIVLPNVDLNYNGVFNFRSSDPSIASVSSSTVTINSIGTVTLFADLSADENYNAKTVTVTLIVSKANQSIIVEPFDLVKPLKDFSSFTVSATSTSGAPVIISLAPGSAASLSGTVGNYTINNINLTGIVTITFTTDASAHPNYNSATVTLVVDVIKTNQNITLSPEPTEFLYYEENLTYIINAFSDSSLNVDYRIISGTNAVLNGNTLEILGIGELKIEVSQPGNSSFNPAVSRSFIIKVLQGMTILSNFNIPDKLIIDDDFVISPPSSNRPGIIKYISSNPNIAVIVDDQIIIKGIGSCTISAIQIATPDYKSASISTIFTVNDTDCDSDGIGDTIDEDDDNDGVKDTQETLNGTDPCVFDTDNDLLGDGEENQIGSDPNNRDTDKDGIIDGLDDFPLDPNESVDSDGDGIGDNSDDDVNGDGFSDQQIFVSALVTPGVRGNEATWKVINIQNYPKSKVSIYDRNGLQVYKKINYQNDWAGTFKQTGDLLPAGSYYYIIEVSDNNKVLQGWLYLTY